MAELNWKNRTMPADKLERMLIAMSIAAIFTAAIPAEAMASGWGDCMRYCYSAYTKVNPRPLPKEWKPGDPIPLTPDLARKMGVPYTPKPQSEPQPTFDGKWSWERFKACKRECQSVR